MPIDGDRKLAVGTKLVARYKGHDYKCVVAQAEDGSLTYDIDGEHFKSPSRAGTHVMGGIACNGWRFWSLEGSEAAKKAAKPKAKKAAKKAVKAPAKKAKRAAKPKAERKPRAKKAPETNPGPAGFDRVADGRYFCNGCMAPFATDDDLEPKTCPKGHSPQAEETLADEAAVAEEAAVVD